MTEYQKPKAVMWDIDDVLTPTSETFYESALQTHGNCPHPDHWSDYLWGKHIGLEEGQPTQDYLVAHRIIETTKPYDYTHQALTLTTQLGYKNVLVSARAWHPLPWKTTHQWVDDHHLTLVIHDQHFVHLEEPKIHRLQKLMKVYDIVAYVEDNPFHAYSAIGFVDNIYLVRRPWNQEHWQEEKLHHVQTALAAAEHIATLKGMA